MFQVVVGGESSDLEIVSSDAVPNAILAMIQVGGLYKWSIQFHTMYDSIGDVIFNNANDKIAVSLYPFAIGLISSTNG